MIAKLSISKVTSSPRRSSKVNAQMSLHSDFASSLAEGWKCMSPQGLEMQSPGRKERGRRKVLTGGVCGSMYS